MKDVTVPSVFKMFDLYVLTHLFFSTGNRLPKEFLFQSLSLVFQQVQVRALLRRKLTLFDGLVKKFLGSLMLVFYEILCLM